MTKTGTHVREVARRGGRRASGAAVASLLAVHVVAGASLSAQAASATPIALWLADAPLARVLEHVAGTDGIRVVVDDSIDGVVDGRLDGERESVLARLVVEHGLAVHGDGDTIWFDRADRPVIEFVDLPPSDADTALSLLEQIEADLASPDAVVERSDEGVMLSGPRAFVESALDRLAALPQESLEAADTVTSDVSTISDIPGYDVDYTLERRL